MSDLIERLRGTWCGRSGMYDRHHINPDGPEAADRIAALEAEVERLRKAGDGLAEAMRDAVGEIEAGAPLTALDVLTEALTHWQEVSNG